MHPFGGEPPMNLKNDKVGEVNISTKKYQLRFTNQALLPVHIRSPELENNQLPVSLFGLGNLKTLVDTS